MKKVVIFLFAILLLGGCDINTETEQDNEPKASIQTEQPEVTMDPAKEASRLIQNNIDTKLTALDEKDVDLYMSTVTLNDEYYYNEQGRWFTEMIKETISDLSLELLEVKLEDDKTAVVTIRQKHVSSGESFDFKYPLLYKFENDSWVDCGYNFEILETERFTLKFMEGDARAQEFADMLNVAYDNLETIFEERADDNFEIKIFRDREMLRQRTVPSITWLFTGWGEPNESLKMYSGHQNFGGYQGTLQHELVHHITIKICNNNLPVWVLDGIAMYYGNAYFDHSLSTTLSNIKLDEIDLTIEQLESTDLYNPDSQQEVWNWYNASYMYIYYIVETYGHDKLMEIFYEAGKKPFQSSVMNESFEKNNQQTLTEILPGILGLTKDELSENYLEWLKTQQKE